ncbi:MAG: hypothetical protein H7Y11_02905, partial [Armatimonadetes bacterium]|nr:hypothetical protein [Anaerolineae bacterium]
MKHAIYGLVISLLCVLGAGVVVAQDGTTSNSSNVNILFVVCDTKSVMNLSGTIDAGYDIYYQVFNAAGTSLTGLRRVLVSTTYAVSDQATFDLGATVAAGAAATAT